MYHFVSPHPLGPEIKGVRGGLVTDHRDLKQKITNHSFQMMISQITDNAFP